MDLLNEINTEPKFAPLSLRLAAGFVDFFSFWIVGVILGMFFGKYETTSTDFGFHITGLPVLYLILFWFLAIPIAEGLTGQTIGKRLCKIIVVRNQSGKTNVFISLVRHLFDIIDIFFFFIGFILIGISKKKQRIGDLIAGTYVVIK